MSMRLTFENFRQFENNDVEWGMDFGSEHERYLSEKVFKKPVCCYNYPKGIKAFYMRENEDGKTVASMDVLVPGVGELIGGSQREERFELLQVLVLPRKPMPCPCPCICYRHVLFR
jgi:asparaginyl-tRNA synthetase